MASRSVTSGCLLVLLALPGAPAKADSWRYGIDAEYLHDSNISRGPTGLDEKSDNIVAAEPYVARSLLLGERSGLVLRGGLRASQHFSCGDLSNLALSGRAGRMQPSLGYSAPWLEVAGTATWLRHRDSDLRDGAILGVSAGTGSYVTDRLRVGLGIGVEERMADEGDLYELSTRRIWATLDYRVGIASALYGSVTRVDGDHVFNAIYGNSQARLSTYAERFAPDPALAEGYGGSTPAGYRIEAGTFVYELGFNLPLSGTRAVDLSASYFDSETDAGGLSYDGYALRAAFLYRFR